jgi:hypothetical protein
MRFGDEFPACRDMRFACASTLTLILITSYFVRCILYIKDSWVSSEISYHEGTKDDGRKTQDSRRKTKAARKGSEKTKRGESRIHSTSSGQVTRISGIGWPQRHKGAKGTAGPRAPGGDYADYVDLGIRAYKRMRIYLWGAIRNEVWG